MKCSSPFSAFDTGLLTDTGKKQLIIVPGLIDWLSLESVEAKGFSVPREMYVFNGGRPGLGNPLLVPCGKCSGCKANAGRDWSTRLQVEALGHRYNYFVTLTYAPEALPFVNGAPALRKRDFQLFMKRFRKRFLSPIRFFACGEYGDKTNRPHYHAILFMDEPLPSLTLLGRNVYRSPDIASAWSLGLSEVSYAEPSCMAYVAGYVQKKYLDDRVHEVEPFALMSRRPGLGSSFLSEHPCYESKVYLKNGKTAPLPRFFKDKLEWYCDNKDHYQNIGKASFESLRSYYGGTVEDVYKGLRFDNAESVREDHENKNKGVRHL